MNPLDPQKNGNHTYDVLKKHLPLNRPIEHQTSAEDQNRIEELKKKLYSKSMSGVDHIKRPGLHEHAPIMNEDWKDENEVLTPKIEVFPQSARRRGVFKKFFIFSILVFLVAAAYGAYQLLNGNNFVSGANLDIKITGPASVSSGDTLILDVDIVNRNSSQLDLADLVMTYPEGTRQTADNTRPIISDRIAIGTIKAGETIRKRIELVFFAEEGSKKTLSAALEYRIPGSTSIFRKQKDIPIAIGNSPITLSIDTINQITTGQEVTLNLNVKSNSPQLLRGILIKAEYPYGFKFKSATPLPAAGVDTWNLGDVLPNSEQKIQIVGTMTSDENQERTFKFNVGTVDPNDENQIGTTFVSVDSSLAVKKPFIGSDLIIEGKSDKNVSVVAGENIQAEVVWQNNLDVPINDVVIEAKFNGAFLDRKSIHANPGFFRSTDNTIVWDKTTVESLKELEAGETGRVIFSFSSLPPSKDNVGTTKNPAISVDLTVRGTRLNENAVPENIQAVVTKTAQVKSEMALTTKLLRTIGPFENHGPFPTKAENGSTFTVNVQVANSFNTIKNAIYKTTLPNYVEWTSQTSPSSAQVSYDPLTRTVSWKIGDIPSGTGYSTPLKEVFYQVGFKPSISQIGSTPVVINEQSVTGTDGLTGGASKAAYGALNIKIEQDPAYVFGQDHVLGE